MNPASPEGQKQMRRGPLFLLKYLKIDAIG